MHPMAIAGDPHADQPWTRLHQDGHTVGYCRSMGDATYYSKDGYGWSAAAIKHDVQLPQVRRSLFRHRIYHGDLVKMPARAGAQDYEIIAVLAYEDTVWLWHSETDQLRPLEESWPPPSRPRIHSVLGSMYENPEQAARIDASFQWLVGPGTPRVQDCVGLGVSLVLGLALVLVAQILAMNSVGPVTSSLGVLGASILYFLRRRRGDWYVLRRDWMLRLSVLAGGLMGGASASTYGILMAVNPSSVDGQPAVVLTAMAVLGLLVGIIATIIGADLVAWRTGGYAGEYDSENHFRSLG